MSKHIVVREYAVIRDAATGDLVVRSRNDAFSTVQADLVCGHVPDHIIALCADAVAAERVAKMLTDALSSLRAREVA